jgi:hypothetical protein
MMNNILNKLKKQCILDITDIKITNKEYIYINCKTTTPHSKETHDIEIQILSDEQFSISFNDFEAMNHIQYLLKTFKPEYINTFHNAGILYMIKLTKSNIYS